MRGQKIYEDIIRHKSLRLPSTKGRNNMLIVKRNDCLLARYYYYGYYRNKCYEEIIRCLVCEFFLSPATVTSIIQNNTEVLENIKQRSPVMYYFQSHWPHLKW